MSKKVSPADMEAPIPKAMVGKVVSSSDGPLAAPQSEGFQDMGDGWKLYVESWRVEETRAPRAVFVFHHGNCLSSSGCADGRRLGHALTAAGIELWSFDMHGCGYSIEKHGKRVRRMTTEGTHVGTRHFLTLCENVFVPRAKELGVPLIACGHSQGGANVMMGTQGLLMLCNREGVHFPLALYCDPACGSGNCCFDCCCGGCGRCCRAHGPACCDCRLVSGQDNMGFAYQPLGGAEQPTTAEGVPLPATGPGDCWCCDALYLGCSKTSKGGWPDATWAGMSFGVHIKEPKKPRIVFILFEKRLAESARPVWKAATSEGGKAAESPSDAFEWIEYPGMQHQFLSDVQWKKVLHETIVPKVESALGKDLSQALAAPAQEDMGEP